MTIGFLALLWLLFLPQAYFHSIEAPNGPRWYIFAGRLALAPCLWAILSPSIFWLGQRFAFERPWFYRNLGVHLLFAFAFASIHSTSYHFLVGLFDGSTIHEISSSLFQSRAGFMNSVNNGFVFYAGILAVNQAAIYSRRYLDRDFRLQQAELQVLKTQIHPHFLFNALNAISALIYVSPSDATRTISQLGDLLRLTLHHTAADEVPLRQELEFLEKYVQIHQTLLRERLEVEWAISSDTLDALVPNLLLQPLVENSIRHGIAPKEEGGRIEISSRRINNGLLIEIEDNGLGEGAKRQTKNVGIGLINSATRLKHHYGEAQSFETGPLGDSGWRVSILIPFHEKWQRQSR